MSNYETQTLYLIFPPKEDLWSIFSRELFEGVYGQFLLRKFDHHVVIKTFQYGTIPDLIKRINSQFPKIIVLGINYGEVKPYSEMLAKGDDSITKINFNHNLIKEIVRGNCNESTYSELDELFDYYLYKRTK